MIYGSFSVKSECGLAKVSEALGETVISLYAAPLDGGKNYVFSIVNSRKSEELEPLLLNDFVSYKIHSENGIILLQGIKRGHGLIKAIVDSGAVPSFPLLARGDIEVLNFMSLSDRSPSALEDSLGYGNNLDDFFFDKVGGERLILDVTQKWGVLGTVSLTNAERDLIKAAYKHGFFEWPRMYDLDLMKRDYNLSKPTILYHMRNAERKIMQMIFG
ncbi:MAG: helix-turn-helix domain-containing protein [Thermoplasmataceae archaeon]